VGAGETLAAADGVGSGDGGSVEGTALSDGATSLVAVGSGTSVADGDADGTDGAGVGVGVGATVGAAGTTGTGTTVCVVRAGSSGRTDAYVTSASRKTAIRPRVERRARLTAGRTARRCRARH